MKYPKLKAKRVELGYNQQDMANKLGITTTTYNFKENGKREFTADEISKVLTILQSRYEDIFLTNLSHK